MDEKEIRRLSDLRSIGREFLKDGCAFGTGIPDSFPKQEEMSLQNLREVRMEIIKPYTLTEYKNYDNYEDLEKFLVDKGFEVTKENLIPFLSGIRDWLIEETNHDYIMYYDMDYEDEDNLE